MTRVFVLEEPRNLDVSGLDVYGPRIVLVRAGDKRPSIWRTKEFVQYYIDALHTHKYDPDQDFLALAGGTLGILLVVSQLTIAHPVKLLAYDCSCEKYVPITAGEDYET